jgi:tetratricopeptide (TPR) repeat protein
MLGNIYINEELNELAADAYMRAMAMSTTAGPDAVVRAAKVLAARGAAEQARTLMDRIETAYAGQLPLQTQQDLKKIRYRIAVARGDAEDAAGVLTEIVEQNPLDGEALIWLGQHYEKIDKAEQAVFYYQRAAGLEKFEADAKVRHAQLLVKQRKYAEALPLLRSSQQLKPRESVQKFLEDVERFAKSKG